MVAFPALSVGHALDDAVAGVGVVHSVFAHALNFEIRGDLWTLLAQDQADLPFGIRMPVKEFEFLGLRPGDCVNTRSGYVGIRSLLTRLVVDCRAAPRWGPTFQARLAPGLADRLAVVAAAARERCWHGSFPMAHSMMSALDDPAALGDVLAGVVGCGPGLTPAGDDVLVGILAVLTSPHSGARGAKAAERLGQLMCPLLSTTTDVSRHLLRQAARGLLGRSVHELVLALIGEPTPTQLRGAVKRVVEKGATSGADTCAGLLECAPSFLTP